MRARSIVSLTFSIVLCAALLPEHYLSKETQDVVRLGAGLTATMAALVLGILIGGAKGSFDTRSTQVKQFIGNIILVDNLLAQYGPEATPLRKALRGAINPLVDRLFFATKPNPVKS